MLLTFRGRVLKRHSGEKRKSVSTVWAVGLGVVGPGAVSQAERGRGPGLSPLPWPGMAELISSLNRDSQSLPS